MRPFRIVIADDQNQGDFVPKLWRRCVESGHECSGQLEVFWVRKLAPGMAADPFRYDPDSFEMVQVSPNEWDHKVVTQADLLILDLAMNWSEGGWAEVFDIDNEVSARARQARGPNNHGGHAFLVQCREHIKARNVFFLTQHATKQDVERELAPVLGGENPFVAMFAKASETESVIDRVEAAYRAFSSGYADLDNWEAIDFAAAHNYPVLIVGESGTGKEYIARTIHTRWRQRNCRMLPGLSIPNEPTVVNCAALAPSLARGELFGYIKGAFTGAERHAVGAILRACGCRTRPVSLAVPAELAKKSRQLQVYSEELHELAAIVQQEKDVRIQATTICDRVIPFLQEVVLRDGRNAGSLLKTMSEVLALLVRRAESDDSVEEFRAILTSNGLLEESGNDLRFKDSGPFGTLFLDEFGDLPSDVQTLLLRYLESSEVFPVGSPFVIQGANTRIIAATSDPRVAAFVGERLIGSSRTQEELRRPLRVDLLFRVKGQVIRAEPVTHSNVAAAIDRAITNAKVYVGWSKGARDALELAVKSLLTNISDDGESSDRGVFFAFGHRRELSRVVNLANARVLTAKERGLRRQSDLVTAEDVDAVWKPSRVLCAAIETPNETAANTLRTAHDPLELREQMGIDDNASAGDWILAYIVSEIGKRLTADQTSFRFKRDVLKERAATTRFAESTIDNNLSQEKVDGLDMRLSDFGYSLTREGRFFRVSVRDGYGIP